MRKITGNDHRWASKLVMVRRKSSLYQEETSSRTVCPPQQDGTTTKAERALVQVQPVWGAARTERLHYRASSWFHKHLLMLNSTHRCHFQLGFSKLPQQYYSYTLTHTQTSINSLLPSLLSFLTRQSDSCGQTPPCSQQSCGPLLDDRDAHNPLPRLPPQRTRKPPSPMSHLIRDTRSNINRSLSNRHAQRHQRAAVWRISTCSFWIFAVGFSAENVPVSSFC